MLINVEDLHKHLDDVSNLMQNNVDKLNEQGNITSLQTQTQTEELNSSSKQFGQNKIFWRNVTYIIISIFFILLIIFFILYFKLGKKSSTSIES